MTWAPGELERAEFFYAQRGARLAHRAMLMESLSATDRELYDELFARYAALLRPNRVEEPYEDTIPATNQNVW